MSDIAPLIAGSEKLTSIFGLWPSCHDAEVHELYFQRGHIDTHAKIYEFPSLTAKLHLWWLTNELDHKGYYILTKHTLATIKFYEVADLKMEGFNQQNVIFGLGIEQKTRDDGPTPYFAVEFEASFGIDATFTCLRIEVLEAVPYESEGNTP